MFLNFVLILPLRLGKSSTREGPGNATNFNFECNHPDDEILFDIHIITADRLCAANGSQAGRSEIRVMFI